MLSYEEEFRMNRKLGHRSELEMRMDILKAIYQGISRPTRIQEKANLNYATTKCLLQSLAKKRYIKLISDRTIKGRKDRHYTHSLLSIVITEDGLRVLLAARALKRQLMDEEPDWN